MRGSSPPQLLIGMTLTAAKGNSLDFADGGGEPRVSKFSFNPAAKEFTPSSMPSGPNAAMSPQARSRPQRIPEWKPSNKIRGEPPYRHVLGRAQEGVEQDLPLDPQYATYRNAPWWEQRLGGLLAGIAEDASSVEGGTACAFRAERVAGNTGRGGEEAPRAMINTGRANGKLEEVLAGM